MTALHAATTTTPKATPIARQLTYLYGREQTGWAVLGFIDGDPRLEPMQEEWFHWPRQRSDMLARAQYHAEQHGNIYAGLCLHTKRSRSYDTALPSPWLWTDDLVHDAEHFSLLVEISAGNYQGYVLLDEALPAAERSALQRGLRAAHGGDDCSADAVHMVRLVDGFNTKRHGRYPVRFAKVQAHPLSAAQARERWPQPATVPADAPSLDLEAVELAHGNIAPLVERARRTLKPGTLAYTALVNGKKGVELDWSVARYHVAGGLVAVGFPDEEIAALVWHWSDNGPLSWGHLKGKASKAKNDDIARIIGKHRSKMRFSVNVSPTRGARTEPAKPLAKSPARKDRPQRITAESYLTWLHTQATGGAVLLSVAECAAAHNVNERTIQRIERVLVEAERITKKQLGQRSRVITLRGDIIPAVSPLESAEIPQQSAENNVDAPLYTHPPVLPEFLMLAAQEVVEAVTPQNAPEPEQAGTAGGVPLSENERPTLRAVVVEALELYPGLGRRTFGAVLAHAGIYGYGNKNAIRHWYKRSRSIWNMEREKVRQMGDDTLLKTIAGRQKTLARHVGTPREGYHRTRCTIADEERQRRGLVMPERPVKIKAVTPKKRAAAVRAEQVPQVPEVEQLGLEAVQPTKPAPGWKLRYSKRLNVWDASRHFGPGEYDYETTRAYAQQTDAIAETWRLSSESEAAVVLEIEAPRSTNDARQLVLAA